MKHKKEQENHQTGDVLSFCSQRPDLSYGHQFPFLLLHLMQFILELNDRCETTEEEAAKFHETSERGNF